MATANFTTPATSSCDADHAAQKAANERLYARWERILELARTNKALVPAARALVSLGESFVDLKQAFGVAITTGVDLDGADADAVARIAAKLRKRAIAIANEVLPECQA